MANSEFPLFDRRPKRKLAAILAADVVGFSKMMGENEDRTLNNLKACREITDGAIREHHGRVFGTAGDSVIAEFASPVDAILAAVEFQRNLMDRNAVVSLEDRMQFRVGLNLGDVIVEGDNLFGDGVNVAARLEPLAKPGGICISGKFHDEVHRKLELLFENVGPRDVKNIENPVQTYHVVFDQNLENIVARKFKKIEEKNPQGDFDQDRKTTVADESTVIERKNSTLLKDKKPRIIILPFQ
ncbi:MAG: adenylate/guanylate cyclase domain-containing protein, partial [SAR324 cluster bacterium]|nr:adenylate/guanylate cyclase domain-containing protein [SAR324 cluster bacterium]